MIAVDKVRTFYSSFLRLIALFSFVGCTQSEPPTPPPPTWLSISLAQALDWETLVGCGKEGCSPWRSLFRRGIMETNGSLIQANPYLVKRLSHPSSQTWEIEFHPDLKWSDNAPFLAEHVIQSWRKKLVNCRDLPLATSLFFIQGAEEFCEGKLPFEKVGLSSSSANHLTLVTAKGASEDLAELIHPSTFPDPPGASANASLGPFTVIKREASQWVLQRNAMYPARYGAIHGIRFIRAPSASIAIQAFLRQETDFIPSLDEANSAQLAKHPQLKTFHSNESVALWFRTDSLPVSLRDVRRQLVTHLDLEHWLSMMTFPHLFLDPLPSQALKTWPEIVSTSKSELSEKSGPQTITLSSRLKDHPEHRQLSKELFEYIKLTWEAKLGVQLKRCASSESCQAELVLVNDKLPRRLATQKLLEATSSKSSRDWALALEKRSRGELNDEAFLQLVREEQGRFFPLLELKASTLIRSPVEGIQRAPFGQWNLSEVQITDALSPSSKARSSIL